MTVRTPTARPRRAGWPKSRLPMYLVLIVVGLVFVGPLYWLAASALKPTVDIYRYPPIWVPFHLRWANFSDAWHAAPVGRFFVNSVLVSTVATAVELVFATLCAYAFAFLRFPAKRVLFLVLLGAMMVPGNVTLLPNYLTISDLGWVNTYQGLIVPGLGSVFGTFLLRQHMLTLPDAILDAARMDGASHLRTLVKIVLPVSRPMVVTVGIVTLVTKWNDFIWPLIVTNSNNMRTVPVGLLLLKSQEGYNNWGAILAGAVLAVVPVLVVFFFAQRHLVAGLTQGATKG
ncbi:carbohydrate ABC transporter permease [Rugosimonospora africana]|uniref:Glycerol-3-phosphate ABC transporter permease n=1 Tax=Rugosimonospora africana TaxID=556532 RepID=A0A8J3QSA7_9ACTN|nr:carbohydrate ABC transporter permease [Rugosimonospora africana]GIH15784.1 glycerol-3-phosphate ABC transporter permease [Rugosimonospora africana]